MSSFIEERQVSLNLSLAFVRDFGPPTIYICGNFNSKWLDNQNDRYNYLSVKEIFDVKLTRFIENLKTHKYFDGMKLIYVMYAIEKFRFISFDVPKLHMMVKFEEVTKRNFIPYYPSSVYITRSWIEFIDKYITAEKPIRENYLNLSKLQFRALMVTVKRMEHRCSAICTDDSNGECSRGFNMVNIVPETYIDTHGVVHYRRRKIEDVGVIPYNPELLLDWDACMSVQFLGPTSRNCSYILRCLHENEVTLVRRL
jgi:hypothetical protein